MPERLSPALKAVSDAVLAVASQLSVDEVLQRLVDRARELAGARYAALGIPDGSGGFRRFLVAGHERRAGGLDGTAAADARDARRDARDAAAPICTDDIHARSALPRLVAARSIPDMRSFLGVPIVARGRGDRRLLPHREAGRADLRRGATRS